MAAFALTALLALAATACHERAAAPTVPPPPGVDLHPVLRAFASCADLEQAIEDALNPRLKVAHLSVRRWRIRPLAGRGPGAI